MALSGPGLQELRRRHYAPVAGDTPATEDAAILRQIRLDIPRTSPGLPRLGGLSLPFTTHPIQYPILYTIYSTILCYILYTLLYY